MKRVISLFFLLLATLSFSQAKQPWRSFFSYNNVVDIAQSGDRVFAGADYAVFSKSTLTNELKTITSVDGLKAEAITAIHHSTAFNKTIVGNSNGLLIVINADNSILNVIDIIQETTVRPDRKKINHIYEYEGKAYVATDFGIVVFNLATMEFGDTYYMGPAGAEIPVMQCAVYNGFIYAATPNNGIRRAQYGNLFLNDYNQWTEDTPGNFTGILSFNNMLFATNSNGTIFRLRDGNFMMFAQMPSVVVDLRESNGYMVLTSSYRVTVYDQQLSQRLQINFIPDEPVIFTCATIVTERVFIGTQERGVFSTPLTSPFPFDNITPDGPQRSSIFSLEKTPNFLWAVYGGYTADFNPYPLRQYGVSKLTPSGWFTIPNDELFEASSIVDIIANPNNENQLYAASYHSGLVKIENNTGVKLYDQTNTGGNGQVGLESLIHPSPGNEGYRSVRIESLAFDKAGSLWMTNANVDKPLKELKPDGRWASYSFAGVTTNLRNDNYSKMVIDKNNTKWIPSIYNGVIAFNETMNNKFILIDEQTGNLPFREVKSLAIDNNNQLWIGTTRGLRVLQGVDRFTTEETLTTNAIIIEEDGLAQELMFEQTITDIEIDGANNKWIGTTAGAFLVSPDGQKTLFHFTRQNSPLPSNNINDIEIDNVTGEVFFATDKGMVSYQGTSTAAEGDLSKVYVFPNPVRPGFEGEVNISGLIDKANIKITDIEGNLVHETTSEGGTVLWDTKAFGKYKVASGVYMIFIVSEDGSQTKTKKVMIIR